MRRLWNEIPRKLRFCLDALLALALLFAAYVALGCPPRGEIVLFRRAEKADLVGPSEIIERMDVRSDWFYTPGTRLLIGDDGEEILLWFYRAGNGTFIRCAKTEGLLLLPMPHRPVIDTRPPEKDLVEPLFLFADDPAAVKAAVHIQMSETEELTLTQVRGALAQTEAGDEYSRERFFLFRIPVERKSWSLNRGALLRDMLYCYEYSPFRTVGYPATIYLYDAEGRLLETREWTL